MNIVSIVAEAFLVDILCNHWEEIPKGALKHIVSSINYKNIPENFFISNEEIRNMVRWDRVEKMKLLRILIRCLDQEIKDLDKIKKSLKRHDYKVRELRFLLKREPEYIQHFPIDLSKVGTSDAATLLSLGHSYYLDKIDLLKHNFNFKESMNIIVGYNYERSILEKVNYKSLKGYQVSDILIQTGDRDLDLLNISTLTNIDWVNLLEHRPDLLKYCDYTKFMMGDIFYSIKLCCMFKDVDLSHLIIDRNMDDISPFGWEKLIIEKPETFLAYCNFSKLDENNWKQILETHPEFVIYKN